MSDEFSATTSGTFIVKIKGYNAYLHSATSGTP
ncbi:hypothetical protein HDF23_001272 [Mucilaginibacter lappiensis]|uniref:NERD domain-containing protein n=1 Tax=Mucilaginibacter lappiensis TaxID=354630 RepID=A0ABR6PFK8_9SPHI|nr:hypothetical protein [Mucilaginibacter lappiensis]